MAFYSYLSTKIIMAFITKSYQNLFGVRSYINALYNPTKNLVISVFSPTYGQQRGGDYSRQQTASHCKDNASY